MRRLFVLILLLSLPACTGLPQNQDVHKSPCAGSPCAGNLPEIHNAANV